MVKVMVAGDIKQKDIAGVLGISRPTLRKHFRREIDTGMAEIQAQVVASLVTMAVGRPARRGTDKVPAQPAVPADFRAAKWFSQARMGWTERIIVDDGKPAGTPLRVIVEYVGEAAPPRTEGAARFGLLPEDMREHVQLVG
jgi:AraC-like DNA-binding protein